MIIAVHFVLVTEKFNNKTMEFEPCEPFPRVPSGNGYIYSYDLKTAKGVINRMRRKEHRAIGSDIALVRLYQCSGKWTYEDFENGTKQAIAVFVPKNGRPPEFIRGVD